MSSFLRIVRLPGVGVRLMATKSNPADIRPLYLDAQATTPLDPRVLDAMLPYMTGSYLLKNRIKI